MRINSRSRIAINAMLDVALHGAHVPVALITISERLDVSLSYLEQLFRRLRQEGLVKSSRGPGGGYRLNKRLSSITVADIVDVVDDETEGSRTIAGKRRDAASAAGEFWQQLDRHLIDYLGTVTLESILVQYETRTARRTETHQPHAARLGTPQRAEERRAA